MTQVDFYILKNAPLNKTEHFVCQLTEKAFKKGHKVHIHTADTLQTERMDTLMWTYNDLSFLPHALADSEQAAETPIHISHNPDNASINDVLINLKSEVPVFYEQFQRVVEIVSGDGQQQQAARQRYRHYQQRGCTVNSHEVTR